MSNICAVQSGLSYAWHTIGIQMYFLISMYSSPKENFQILFPLITNEKWSRVGSGDLGAWF